MDCSTLACACLYSAFLPPTVFLSAFYISISIYLYVKEDKRSGTQGRTE